MVKFIFDGGIQDDFLGFFPITFKSDDYFNLVPYVLKSTGVIKDIFGKYLAVRTVDHPSCTLVRTHPVADFKKRSVKKTDIDHIPLHISYLNPVSGIIGPSDKKQQPTSNRGDRLV